MNLHAADVNRRLTDFLDRRQAPRSFAANEAAKADQISAYLGILTRAAPPAPALDEWWGRFLEALSDLSETWAWPSEKEIRNACKAISGSARRDQPGDAWRPDSVAINLARLNSGEPIGEDWLWGRQALQLVAAGADRHVMRERRIAAAEAMAAIYGPDETRARLAVLKARHEAAEAERGDWQRHPRDTGPMLQRRSPFTRQQLEEMVA